MALGRDGNANGRSRMAIYLTGYTHGLDDIGKLQGLAWALSDWRPTTT